MLIRLLFCVLLVSSISDFAYSQKKDKSKSLSPKKEMQKAEDLMWLLLNDMLEQRVIKNVIGTTLNSEGEDFDLSYDWSNKLSSKIEFYFRAYSEDTGRVWLQENTVSVDIPNRIENVYFPRLKNLKDGTVSEGWNGTYYLNKVDFSWNNIEQKNGERTNIKINIFLDGNKKQYKNTNIKNFKKKNKSSSMGKETLVHGYQYDLYFDYVFLEDNTVSISEIEIRFGRTYKYIKAVGKPGNTVYQYDYTVLPESVRTIYLRY